MTESNFRGYKLADVMPILGRIAADDFGWMWARNARCKYIQIHIDTRDGGYARLTDRDGNDIRLEELAFQYERP